MLYVFQGVGLESTQVFVCAKLSASKHGNCTWDTIKASSGIVVECCECGFGVLGEVVRELFKHQCVFGLSVRATAPLVVVE